MGQIKVGATPSLRSVCSLPSPLAAHFIISPFPRLTVWTITASNEDKTELIPEKFTLQQRFLLYSYVLNSVSSCCHDFT